MNLQMHLLLPARFRAATAAAVTILCLGAAFPTTLASEAQTMSERTLKRIVERQKDLFADAQQQGENLDVEAFRTQVQALAHDYEMLLRANPDFAAGYAAYGYLLSRVDMRKEAAAILLRANQLDPDIALVKNQLGNVLAEDGKPLLAAPYYLAAIKLEPDEPLYHYQLGMILTEARDDFLQSGEWSRATLDETMLHSFQRAAELAPDRFEFTYRYAEAFYDVEKPDWNAALKIWSTLEENAETAIERQTMRLHAANILLKLGKPEHARMLLSTIDDPKLQGQKQTLVGRLETPAK
jgi:tetratricopeptide (TPR) repeat protein